VYCHLEKHKSQEVFLSQTFISQREKMLYAPASNTDIFLLGDTCVSSTQLNRPIWNNESLAPPGKHKLLEVFLSQTYSILTGKKMCYMLLFLTQMFFFQEIHVFLQLSGIGLFGKKRAYLHIENP
jgi:hypothetical protein